MMWLLLFVLVFVTFVLLLSMPSPVYVDLCSPVSSYECVIGMSVRLRSPNRPICSRMSTGYNFSYFLRSCSPFHYPVYGQQEEVMWQKAPLPRSCLRRERVCELFCMTVKPNAHGTQNCFSKSETCFAFRSTLTADVRNGWSTQRTKTYAKQLRQVAPPNCEVILLQNGGIHKKEQILFGNASYNANSSQATPATKYLYITCLLFVRWLVNRRPMFRE